MILYKLFSCFSETAFFQTHLSIFFSFHIFRSICLQHIQGLGDSNHFSFQILLYKSSFPSHSPTAFFRFFKEILHVSLFINLGKLFLCSKSNFLSKKNKKIDTHMHLYAYKNCTLMISSFDIIPLIGKNSNALNFRLKNRKVKNMKMSFSR